MGRWSRCAGSTLSVLGLLAAACGRPAPPTAAEAPRPAAGDTPAAAVATTPPAQERAQPSTAAHPNQADRPVLRDFEARVKEYAALHNKLEDSLPKLPKDATPEQI